VKKKLFILTVLLTTFVAFNGCDNVLDPKPIDQLVNDVVLNEPKDIPAVETGLYRAFRVMRPSVVLAGDFTADNLIHNGTFAQYRELGVKQITTGNATANEMWGTIYGCVYIANFMIERIPEISGVTNSLRSRSIATARFLRGMANFTGVVTFGGIPKVTTTNIEENRTVPRATEEEMLAFIEEDFLAALGSLGAKAATPAIASDHTVRAALARFYLYTKNYAKAEQFASEVINSGDYELESKFEEVVTKDFTSESIFEVGYTIADDDDGTNLNNLFASRREIIPSNQVIVALASQESGDRFSSITFKVENLKGNDNGWEVAMYGTAVQDNNNIVVFRLAEMYLIRAEARALVGNVTGDNSAQSDINVLRARANAPSVGDVSQSQMTRIIEEERRYELAFEGHRWYDLRRTGRIEQVMPAFNQNWRPAFELWPIPQREIQNNTALAGNQNPGY
jgi:hypothetical protein